MAVYDLAPGEYPVKLSAWTSPPEGEGYGKEWWGVVSRAGHEPCGAPVPSKAQNFRDGENLGIISVLQALLNSRNLSVNKIAYGKPR